MLITLRAKRVKKPCKHLVKVDSPFFETGNGIVNNFFAIFP